MEPAGTEKLTATQLNKKLHLSRNREEHHVLMFTADTIGPCPEPTESSLYPADDETCLFSDLFKTHFSTRSSKLIHTSGN